MDSYLNSNKYIILTLYDFFILFYFFTLNEWMDDLTPCASGGLAPGHMLETVL